MRVMLVGQKWLGTQVLEMLLEEEQEVVAVAAPDPADQLYNAAEVAEIEVHVHGPNLPPEIVPEGTDVLICAHAHCFISEPARRRTRLGALGYHPSLLPRHRGRDSIRWAIHMGEQVTGGTVYWMEDRADAGPIAAQDWCFIRPDDDPTALWRRELAPMGIRLLRQVIEALSMGIVVAAPQDEALATWEPSFNRRPLSG